MKKRKVPKKRRIHKYIDRLMGERSYKHQKKRHYRKKVKSIVKTKIKRNYKKRAPKVSKVVIGYVGEE